ncbi:hypothetical protein LCGC14_2487150, partial [marine sediment metagenome]
MPTVYLSTKAYVFLKSESSWNVASAMGNGSSQKHVPLNQMKTFIPPKPKFSETVIYTFDSLEPSIIFTPRLETGEGAIEAFYRDPIGLLLRLFTRKVVNSGGAWLTGGSDNQIVADFVSVADEETIAIQYEVEDRDAANEIDRRLDGCEIIRYEWLIRKGELLMENATIKAAGFADATQAPDIDDGFDDGAFDRAGIDGGFSAWDGEITRAIHSTEITLQFGGSVLAGLSIENFTLTLEVPKEQQHTTDSRNATVHWRAVRAWSLAVDGWLKTKAHLEEAEKVFASKSKTSTLKISYNVGLDKFLQFTNAYISSADFETIPIPEAGQ